LIEAKNSADSLIYSTDKSLREHKSKLTNDVIVEIERDIKKLKETVDTSSDPEAVKSDIDTLQKSAMKIGETIYKQRQSDQTPQSGSSGTGKSESGKPEGETVDAEFEEDEKDEKKDKKDKKH